MRKVGDKIILKDEPGKYCTIIDSCTLTGGETIYLVSSALGELKNVDESDIEKDYYDAGTAYIEDDGDDLIDIESVKKKLCEIEDTPTAPTYTETIPTTSSSFSLGSFFEEEGEEVKEEGINFSILDFLDEETLDAILFLYSEWKQTSCDETYFEYIKSRLSKEIDLDDPTKN